MKQPIITTIQELIDFLKIQKDKLDRLQKRNPDFSISTKSIEDLPVDLIFDLVDFINEGEQSYYSKAKVSFSGDRLSLYCYSSKLPMSCSLSSVKVKRLIDPTPERNQYEVIPQ